MKKIFVALCLIFLLVPQFGFAQYDPNVPSTLDLGTPDYSGFVKCDGVVVKDGSEPFRNKTCDFIALINTVKSLIDWAFIISIPVIVGLLAYAGFLHMTGVEGNLKKARQMLWNAVIGFIIMLCAWFIVTTALKWLLKEEFQKVAGTLVETQK